MSKLNTFQRVRELGHWQSIAFSCTLLERMFPNWQLFCEVIEDFDAKEARKVLDLVWQQLYDKQLKFNIDVQLENIAEQTPDASDFDMFGVYPAIDFCMSLTCLLQFLKLKEQPDIVNISKMSQGTVVSYIEAHQPEISNQELRNDPLMQWEVEFQNELLDKLSKAQKGKAFVKTLQAFALEEGCSNIGIEPVKLND
jgi:uncharacterized protein YjaG (DUF416 family)